MDIFNIENGLFNNITPAQVELLARIKLLEDLSRDITWRRKQLREDLHREIVDRPIRVYKQP